MNLTIQQLKTAVLANVSADWVRENFGKLTLKQTWQDAYDRLSESIVAKADEAIEAAKEVSIEISDTVAILADNCDGLPEALLEVTQKAFWVVAKGIFITACFIYYLGQAYGKGFYKIRQMAAEIELEDLSKPITQADPVAEIFLMKLKSPMLASSILIAA